MLRYSRQIFAQMPMVNNAISQKAQWSAGTAWNPTFIGSDKEWGQVATDWLVNNWYPIASTQGFDFGSCLKLASINLDIDGDILMIYVLSRSGFPQIQFIESHRIGCRNYSDIVVKEGKYKGLPIFNGVIKNESGRPIAYRILGDTVDDDFDISTKNCKLLFDPIHFSMTRGIPKLASAIMDSIDAKDIDEFLKQTVKIQSRISLIRQNAQGEADIQGGNIIVDSQTVDEGAEPVVPTLPNLELMGDGEVLWIDNESDIKALDTSTPSPNTIDFIERIESRIMDSIGWPLYRLDKKGGAVVRSDQELFRSTVISRQSTLWPAAKLAINFAVTNAMQLGMIPQTNGDWWNWDFVYPSLFSVDQGYERAADINDFKLGLKTLDDISAVQGKRWLDIRSQVQVETEDLLKRASVLAKQYNITLDYAINLLSQRTPNPAPLPPVQQNQQIQL